MVVDLPGSFSQQDTPLLIVRHTPEMIIALGAVADTITDINEQTPSQGVGSTYVSGFDFIGREVIYDIKNEWAMFEGDIVLGTVYEAEQWYAAQ